MSSVSWQEHRGVRFLFVEYRGADEADHLAALGEMVRVVQGAPEGTRVLSDVSDAVVSSVFLAALKRASHDVFGPHRLRVAVVGVDGIKRVVLRGLNAVGGGAPGRPFTSREQALDWLVR